MSIRNVVLCGDALEKLRELPDKSAHMCVTSPPYFGVRMYDTGKWVGGDPDCEHETKNKLPVKQCSKCGAIWEDQQIGLEESPEEYVSKLVDVFREVKRVLRDDGIMWVVIGDSYASNGIYIGKYKELHPEHTDLHVEDSDRYPQKRKGVRGGEYNIKPKDLIGIPWLVAFALRNDGWWLRRDIPWAKAVSFCPTYSGTCMPEPVTDRPTSSHEYIFLFAKSARYFYDQEAVKEKTTTPQDTKSNQTFGSIGGKAECAYGSKVSGEDYISSGSRNLRSVWTINPAMYPDAHFATYPPSLIEPMIKLGTSEYGACPKCGAPWVRVVKKGESNEEWKSSCGADSTGEYHGESAKFKKQDALGKSNYTGFNARWKAKQQNASDVKRNVLNGLREVTYEWKPSCDCGCEERVPCIVLDPFAGSGTSGEVARDLGRDYVLIELSEKYVKHDIAKRLRLNEQLGRFV